jgi:hypothetical protein
MESKITSSLGTFLCRCKHHLLKYKIDPLGTFSCRYKRFPQSQKTVPELWKLPCIYEQIPWSPKNLLPWKHFRADKNHSHGAKKLLWTRMVPTNVAINSSPRAVNSSSGVGIIQWSCKKQLHEVENNCPLSESNYMKP